MKNALVIARRELGSYFASPLFYVIATVFLGLQGFLSYNLLSSFSFQSFQEAQIQQSGFNLNINELVIGPSLGIIGFIFMLMVPIITMRSFSEEMRQKTFPLLLGSPIQLWEIVAGKFISCLCVLGVLLVASSYFMGLILILGNPEIGPIVTGYLGVLLMTGCYVAIGVFASSLTDNQLVAAVITFGLVFLMWVIDWAAESAGTISGEILEYLSLSFHLQNFLKGMIDTSDLTYYLSFVIFFLFLTYRVLESRRWR